MIYPLQIQPDIQTWPNKLSKPKSDYYWEFWFRVCFAIIHSMLYCRSACIRVWPLTPPTHMHPPDSHAPRPALRAAPLRPWQWGWAQATAGEWAGQYNYLIQTNQDLFRDFPFIYQIRYNGLDLDRIRAPEHICELWFLLIVLDSDFFLKIGHQ